ncbi:hypothetical protein [Pseudomonas fragi]|uniref:Uncharacterized protein n=1 Tax=Pseudomonas fragi TaxID=296 RepID=A0A9Q5B0S3_PSEFR|nr:hypothetical protein [Pseudomonas fragi]NNB49526.1 hypothetical protein [Pseudomonas fragi]
MGSKIPEAKVESGERVTALKYEAVPAGKIFCCSMVCDAELSFVRRHNRKYQSKTIEIAPCFRLKKHHLHAVGCKYNIEGQLDLIAKSSESEVFEALGKSNYEFRLHVLLKALRVLDEDRIHELAKKWGASFNQNKNYANKGALTNYLRTLGQILELRNYCEEDDQLGSLVVLNYHGKRIKWLDFYYDEKNLSSLIETHGVGSVDIPLAVSGHIYSVKKLEVVKDCHVVELYSPEIKRDALGRVWKSTAQIYLNGYKLHGLIREDKEYIFFGRWEVSLKQHLSSGESGKINYQNIKMHIQNADHFVEV